MLNAILAALVIVVVVIAAITLFQDRLLYFPTRTGLAEFEGGGLRAWPDTREIRGLIAEPRPGTQVRGTAIVFHGNAGHAGHRRFYLTPLLGNGLRVILAEYPGYGPRAGDPGEALLIDDAVRTIATARRQYGEPVLVVGESLGAGVASAAAAQASDELAGLLLITPWRRLSEIASHHYPWLPVRAMLRSRYDSEASLRKFDKPIVVAIAAGDTIVPPQNGRALFDGLSGPKTLLVIDGAGHNDWANRVDDRWWRAALDAAGLSRASMP